MGNDSLCHHAACNRARANFRRKMVGEQPQQIDCFFGFGHSHRDLHGSHRFGTHVRPPNDFRLHPFHRALGRVVRHYRRHPHHRRHGSETNREHRISRNRLHPCFDNGNHRRGDAAYPSAYRNQQATRIQGSYNNVLHRRGCKLRRLAYTARRPTLVHALSQRRAVQLVLPDVP